MPNRNKDQGSRQKDLQKHLMEEIPLVEKRNPLRKAECAAKGGEWRNGKCWVG